MKQSNEDSFRNQTLIMTTVITIRKVMKVINVLNYENLKKNYFAIKWIFNSKSGRKNPSDFFFQDGLTLAKN